MKSTKENNTVTIYLEGRIDSDNAAKTDADIMGILAANPGANIVLEAKDLEYISSAGLRVLLNLRKTAGKKLPIRNVIPEVYDIFDVTGFNELLDVQKEIPSVSIDGLEKIGNGATAQVYRLDRETVLKVFNPNTSMDLIHQENERSKNAFLSGIPTAISYNIVKVGDRYGTMYELLDAQDFLSVVENDKAHLKEQIAKFARATRAMNEIEVDPAKFPSTKISSIYALPRLEGICTKEEIGKLRQIYDGIPDRSTFIHGDCHLGNVMVQRGELMFIDMMTCGSGHPVFEMTSMCTIYHMPPKFGSREANPLLRNFTQEEIDQIWDVYLRTYLDTDDEALLKKAERQITAVASARTLFAAVFLPGLISPEKLEELKRTALEYADEGLEPLVF